MKALADGIGVSVGALRGMAEQGKLTSDVLATALPKALALAASGAYDLRQFDAAKGYWQRLLAESALQSRVTHPHPDCVAACVFVNAMIYEMIHGVHKTDALGICLELDLPEELRTVIRMAPSRKRGALRNTGWVHHTMEAVVWGLMNTDTFEDALVEVVNLGSDADTAGTVVGAATGTGDGPDDAWPPPSRRPRYDFFPGSPDLSAFPRALWARTAREVLLEAQVIDAALENNRGRMSIAVLHGMRGVGKTTLAAAYAERQRMNRRAVWWIRAQVAPSMCAASYKSPGRPRIAEMLISRIRSRSRRREISWRTGSPVAMKRSRAC